VANADLVCVEELRDDLRILVDPLANDHHPDGKAMRVTVASQPAFGEVEALRDGTLLFHLAVAPPPSVEQIQFSYTVNDGAAGASADVVIEACVGLQVFFVFPDSGNTVVGQPLTIPVLANDQPEGGLTLAG
jgi:hypothetical protein